jgi:glycerophosphoryl diester phosphodiesterase
MDIRWTRDLQPVVFHDPETRRVFGRERWIGRMTFERIRRDYPAIPHLQEVVRRFGRRLHLMAELKAEPYPEPGRQDRTLAEAFGDLVPGTDYHLLSLAPEMFQRIRFAPPASFLPIATTNIRAWSRIALQRGYGGLTGHYLLMTRRIMDRHRRIGQRVGTGFPQSANALYREIHRGVDWIFSDRAAALQAHLNAVGRSAGGHASRRRHFTAN